MRQLKNARNTGRSDNSPLNRPPPGADRICFIVKWELHCTLSLGNWFTNHVRRVIPLIENKLFLGRPARLFAHGIIAPAKWIKRSKKNGHVAYETTRR